jgi:DNA-binding response OmpR family regulator
MTALSCPSAHHPLPSRTDHPAILLVEDDPALRRQLAALLIASGFSVSRAADHRRARAIIEAGGPLDLMMTDLVLPTGISGFTLARLARMRRPDLKILYFTGHDLPEDVGESAGPILKKPLDRDPLLATIDGLLQ